MSRFTSHPTLRPALALVLAVLAAVASVVPAGAQSLRASDLRGELLLTKTAEGYQLQRFGVQPQASPLTLPVAENAQLGSLVAAGERWFAAGLEAGTDRPTLLLLGSEGARATRLSSPTTMASKLLSPTLDADARGPRTLAWLEGERVDRLAVKASRFDGERWLEAVTVSPLGPGSQLALASAKLADGSWLLAWSAFDGQDDEILWSRLTNDGWSPPQPVAADNAVPDITPTLVTSGEGVLIAWSRYDGNDYRLHLARFDGEGWSEPQIVGPKGSVAPSFDRADGSSLLLYQNAFPRSWAVAELDTEGNVLRRAESGDSRLERPIASKVSPEGVELRWPAAAQKTGVAEQAAVTAAWLAADGE